MFHVVRSLLASRYPVATVYDVRDDITNLTTYTFSNCTFPPPPAAPVRSNATADWDSMPHSPSFGMWYILIHGWNATPPFTVSTVTVGGVSATVGRDQGGVQSTSDAIFFVNPLNIGNVANNDIVVTWSEAMASCAIAVVGVTNCGQHGAAPFGTGSSAASTSTSINISPTVGTNRVGLDSSVGVVVCTSAISTTAFPSCDAIGRNSGVVEPQLLYHGTNAEFTYAGFFTYSPSMLMDDGTNALSLAINWTGTTTKDVAAVTIF